MKIYVSHASSYDYVNELYRPLKNAFGDEHELFLPHDNENKEINSREIIAEYDLVIAEVSFPSTGQGIELGWADANSSKIVCFKKAGSRSSKSINFVSETIVEYDNIADLIEKIKVFLKT